jgi:hypothetical protein
MPLNYKEIKEDEAVLKSVYTNAGPDGSVLFAKIAKH